MNGMPCWSNQLQPQAAGELQARLTRLPREHRMPFHTALPKSKMPSTRPCAIISGRVVRAWKGCSWATTVGVVLPSVACSCLCMSHCRPASHCCTCENGPCKDINGRARAEQASLACLGLHGSSSLHGLRIVQSHVVLQHEVDLGFGKIVQARGGGSVSSGSAATNMGGGGGVSRGATAAAIWRRSALSG